LASWLAWNYGNPTAHPHRGFILLPEGKDSNVIGLTPPLTITRLQLQECLDCLESLFAS
jgi:4-aminobutyrate aminotransferase-like enzyme